MDSLLDASVYFSFDKSGFKRHQKYFKPMDEKSLESKNILITGGTSGIGAAVARFCCANKASTCITGRDASKFQPQSNLHFIENDLSSWNKVPDILKQIKQPLDILVLNAGSMPSELKINSQSYEHQVASQLFGHFLLFRLLHQKKLLNKKARIIWVSSGGGLLKKLNLNQLEQGRPQTSFNSEYDKVDTYANVKRAQMIMTSLLAQDQKYRDYSFACMHPGWVDTGAVQEALPGFYEFTKNRLRTTEQGADTICYLACLPEKDLHSQNGKLWFDRKVVKTHPLWWTKSYDQTEQKLYQLVHQVIVKFEHEHE